MTVWLTKTGPAVFSNTDHTVSGGNGDGAIASTSRDRNAGGKWYLEFLTSTVGANAVIGFGDARYTTPGVDFQVNDTLLFVNNAFYAAFGNTNTGVAWTTERIGIALDFASGTRRIFYRRNGGAWENSGDPVASTGGLAIGGTSYSQPLTPACKFYGSGMSLTINGGDSAFVDAVPSGYSSWNGVAPFVPKSQPAIIICQ